VQHWYVYYKLPRSERDATIELVRRVQEQLAQSTRVRARLLERTEQPETTTMMEVYEDIDQPERFGAALDAVVRASGLPEAHIAARRVERFQDA
jgi:quinol monooxygenase YgiN